MKDLVALARFSWAGLRLLLAATVVCGVVYPLLITGVAKVVFPWQSDGSLVTATGAHTQSAGDAVGSRLAGQVTESDALFYSRPSAAGDGYDFLSTYGSNFGPSDPDLIKAIEDRKAEVAEREGVDPSQIPPDALTASASGLDPDISEAYAALQVARVAAANGLSDEQVRSLVADNTAGRTWGVLGEPHVNVLMLNIDVLAAAKG